MMSKRAIATNRAIWTELRVLEDATDHRKLFEKICKLIALFVHRSQIYGRHVFSGHKCIQSKTITNALRIAVRCYATLSVLTNQTINQASYLDIDMDTPTPKTKTHNL